MNTIISDHNDFNDTSNIWQSKNCHIIDFKVSGSARRRAPAPCSRSKAQDLRSSRGDWRVLTLCRRILTSDTRFWHSSLVISSAEQNSKWLYSCLKSQTTGGKWDRKDPLITLPRLPQQQHRHNNNNATTTTSHAQSVDLQLNIPSTNRD